MHSNKEMQKHQHGNSGNEHSSVTVGTLFIGGGPATLGVFTHAYQINKIHDLASEAAIIETSDQFGGGNLQQYYGLRSNTSAHGFLKVIQFAKPKKQKKTSEPQNQLVIKKKEYSSLSSGSAQRSSTLGLQGQKQVNGILTGVGQYKSPTLKIQVLAQTQPKQEAENSNSSNSGPSFIPFVMPAFLNFSQSDLAVWIKQTGKSIAPLQIIGSFLSFVGNQILYDIWLKNQGRKLFYANHRAKSVQINEDGTFTTTVEKVSYEVIKEDKVVKILPKTTEVKFHSKNVVFSNGGKQKIPKTFHKKYEISKKAHVFTSDEILRERKFKSLLSIIKEDPDLQIVIIGGSHSAFSIAWLLLNGPCQLRQFQNTQPQRIPQCTGCLSCPLRLTHVNCGQGQAACICQQVCKCVSNPRLPNVSGNEISDMSFPCIQRPGSVKILYREKIKVYYSSQVMAQADQYNEYDTKQDVSKGGIVFPFTGLRGDAKELWRRIKRGQENRIELIRADTQQEQKFYTKQAQVVILACGYETNQIKVIDPSGQSVQFKRLGSNKKSTFEVDAQCRIFPAGPIYKPIEGLYGIGLGYSLKTTDKFVQAEQKSTAKADSVGLYVKQIGHKLLGQILGTRASRVSTANFNAAASSSLGFTKAKDLATSTNGLFIAGQKPLQNPNVNTNSASNQLNHNNGALQLIYQPQSMIQTTKSPFFITPSKIPSQSQSNQYPSSSLKHSSEKQQNPSSVLLQHDDLYHNMNNLWYVGFDHQSQGFNGQRVSLALNRSSGGDSNGRVAGTKISSQSMRKKRQSMTLLQSNGINGEVIINNEQQKYHPRIINSSNANYLVPRASTTNSGGGGNIHAQLNNSYQQKRNLIMSRGNDYPGKSKQNEYNYSKNYKYPTRESRNTLSRGTAGNPNGNLSDYDFNSKGDLVNKHSHKQHLSTNGIASYDLNYWYHRSPEIKKSKLSIGNGNDSNLKIPGASLSSTLATPFTKILAQSSAGQSVNYKKNSPKNNTTSSSDTNRTPLKGASRLKNGPVSVIQRSSQLPMSGSNNSQHQHVSILRYNQQWAYLNHQPDNGLGGGSNLLYHHQKQQQHSQNASRKLYFKQ